MDVIIFVGGTKAAMTRTSGERPDVTRQFHLGFGAEKDVSYAVDFTCKPGEQAIIAGLGARGQYIDLPAGPCP
jgi:hypothetical protein